MCKCVASESSPTIDKDLRLNALMALPTIDHVLAKLESKGEFTVDPTTSLEVRKILGELERLGKIQFLGRVELTDAGHALLP